MCCFIVKWVNEYNALGILTGLHPYDKYFTKLNDDLFLRYPNVETKLPRINLLKKLWVKSINRISLRIENKLNGVMKINSHDFSRRYLKTEDILFKRLLYCSNIIFIRGFVLHQSYSNLAIVHHIITKLFQPLISYKMEINKPFKQLSSKKIKVGVVVRHGDYKTWKNGKYYYSLEIYTQWMQEVCNLFGAENVGFFIASDEVQPLDDLKDFCFYFRYGHPIENLYSLSQCDYIITTKSSFAGWSCFIGKVPHFFCI